MLIDSLHKSYNSTYRISNIFLKKIKLPAVLRLIILQVSNIFIPLIFKFLANNDAHTLNAKKKNKTDFIVSLTSFPNRISKVNLAIESILRQTYCPSRIILWLSEEQFPSLDKLPKKLLALRDRGLEIYLTPGDLRSYKKYYFLLKNHPDIAFIIVDDDIFYPSMLIENLVKTHNKYPKAVCANRCVAIESAKSYSQWDCITGPESQPRLDLLPTGCGGVLYPSSSLHPDAVNKQLFTELCYDADDIWLNCTAYLKKTPVVYTGKNEFFLTIQSLGNVHLHAKNVGGLNNDNRIEAVREFYFEKNDIDIFNRSLCN